MTATEEASDDWFLLQLAHEKKRRVFEVSFFREQLGSYCHLHTPTAIENHLNSLVSRGMIEITLNGVQISDKFIQQEIKAGRIANVRTS